MTTNNNLSPIPFYDSVSQQLHRKSYAHNCVFPFLVPSSLIPFFLIGGNGTATVYRLGGSSAGSISMSSAVVNGQTVYYNTNSGLHLDGGLYYIECGGMCSDVFRVVDYVGDKLKLTWKDSEDMYCNGGAIPFSSGYRNVIYLDTQVGKPDYSIEEEGEERDGHFFPISQISKKSYKFNFIAPEYLCDALRVVRLCDDVTIESGGVTYNVEQFSMDVDWQEQANLAAVTCEFETDTVVKKIGRGY